MVMKTCSKCGDEKDDSAFYKGSSQCKKCKIDYQKMYYQENKTDIKQYKTEYWQENKDKLYEYKKGWRQSYGDVLKHCDIHNQNYSLEECPMCIGIRNKKYKLEHGEEIKEWGKSYRQEHKIEINVYYKNRRENDSEYNLRRIVSSSVYSMIRKQGSSKNGSIKNFLPYTIQQLKEHLEKQFESWMTWANQGRYNSNTWNDNDQSTWTWQLDHIIPQSDFPYTSMADDNFKKCWALENLRPLAAKRNLFEGVNRTRHIKR